MKEHMKIGKKLLCMFLVFSLTLSLAGCGKSNNGSTASPVESDTASPAAISQATEAPYQTATPGVPDELKNSKYDLTKALTEPALKDKFHKYFSVGVAINGSSTDTVSLNSPEMAAITKYHFNSMTYSNLMKPSYLLDQEGSKKSAESGDGMPAVKFDTCIPGLEFAQKNNMKMRGHVLVWNNQVPSWFFFKDYDETKELVDKETMLKRMESYIKQVLTFVQTNYPGVIYAWDVVNEAVETASGEYDASTGWYTRTKFNHMDSIWYEVCGPDYVEKAFEYARKYADPSVKLFYNDYNTFDSIKNFAICNLVKMLKEKNLIDGIGMQSAMELNYPGSISSGSGSTQQALQNFSDLGVEIHMSEITIRAKDNKPETLEKQAQRYEEFFKTVLAMDKENGGPANITNVTFFGMMDNYMFYPSDQQNYWLFDNKLQPKSSFYSVLKAVDNIVK